MSNSGTATKDRRIPADAVVQAYMTKKLAPVRNGWLGISESGKPCGCGVGVYALSRRKRIDQGDTIPEVARRLGLDDSYVCGFVRGFDGVVNLQSDRLVYANRPESRFDAGIEDGQAAWAAVLAAGLIPEERLFLEDDDMPEED